MESVTQRLWLGQRTWFRRDDKSEECVTSGPPAELLCRKPHISASRYARNGKFVEPDQSDCLTGKSPNYCPAPFAKIFRFPFHPNQIYIVSRPTPLEGRIAIVTDAGRDAVDAAASGV